MERLSQHNGPMADTRSSSSLAPPPGPERLAWNRRRFVAGLSGLGLGSTLLPGALTACAGDADAVSIGMLRTAQQLAGLEFSDDELSLVAERLNDESNPLEAYQGIRDPEIHNHQPPSFVFHPLPPGKPMPETAGGMQPSRPEVSRPAADTDLAFLPVTHLARLVETRQVTSTELTELYLARLQEFDPVLLCVVNLTEDLAREQAARADAEIAAGNYRGPLHGIPWGAKDLLAVKGTKTTWGASPYRDQVIDEDSTVYTKLTEAGAVLVAKLTMGALASGDRWFGGRTRNPWNTEQGSSGSSAGPGSATAAGLVGFSIGTETRGSIISPSTRNGITGHRPTFGRVSRAGAMALSWTMDKIGPMCRSAEDCALVFEAIRGADDLDRAVQDPPFAWDASADPTTLRVGYDRAAVEDEIEDDPENPDQVAARRTAQENTRAAIEALRGAGITITPFDLPELDWNDLSFVLSTESAAAHDALSRSGADLGMKEPPEESRWPDTFRTQRFVPAVEYIQAMRVRTRIMREFDEAFGDLDLFIGSNLGLTNLTGHPEVCMPNGYHEGSPTSLRMTGKLYGDTEILTLAHAYQQVTDFHLRKPPVGG